MALRDNFYDEIFKREKDWTFMAKNNLLNIYYLNGQNGIKSFYVNVRNELSKIPNPTPIITNILNMVNNIIIEIENINDNYNNSGYTDMGELVNLFIYNQMYNSEPIKQKK